MPGVGDRARAHHYGGQKWLYHWTTCSHWRQIRRSGHIRPGRGEKWSEGIRHELEKRPRVFWSTQPDKWESSFRGCKKLLRVPTETVDCRYDGGEWIWGDEPESEVIEDRLSDCAVERSVPTDLIEVRGRDGRWRRARKEAFQKRFKKVYGTLRHSTY